MADEVEKQDEQIEEQGLSPIQQIVLAALEADGATVQELMNPMIIDRIGALVEEIRPEVYRSVFQPHLAEEGPEDEETDSDEESEDDETVDEAKKPKGKANTNGDESGNSEED